MARSDKKTMAFCFAAALAVGAAAPSFAQESEQQGLGSNFNGLQLEGDQPISIEANQLDVDDQAAQAVFTGNVQVVQGDTELRTSKLIVHYQKNEDGEGEAQDSGTLPGGSSDIERLEASGKVYVKSADQVATADQGSFDMASQQIVMTGNVVLTQGENVAEGCRLTIQADTGVARLEAANCESGGAGRVRLMLTPDSAGDGN